MYINSDSNSPLNPIRLILLSVVYKVSCLPQELKDFPGRKNYLLAYHISFARPVQV